MVDTNNICREILNSRDVILQRVTEVLLSDLVGPGTLSKTAVAGLTKKVESVLHNQTEQLVDRIIKIS